jgi:eukaryotic-like serine/threonine-protein kinase
MKVCPNCQAKYPDDANFCPQEGCATPEGPRRLNPIPTEPASRFELVLRVGGGHSGEVWQARDAQGDRGDGLVAYKLVAPQVLPTAAALERAQRELKQLQRAQSPRLARIIDFGKTAEGRLFVASELVVGQPLDRLVADGGPLSLERAKKIVAQVGEALLEGQKVGVVHHDLAAKNVLVGAGDEVKLINFVTPWPVTETVFGVPEYLAPEQAEGKLVDQRSNTYSLGALLMLMLTGQPPFSGSDPRAVLDQVIRGELTPPSRRRAGLSPEIDRVVLKAMDKSSSRRPLTMRQFLSDVAGLTTPVGGAPGAQREVAFAKTMMFAGGAPDVQHLVNQAAAARAEANGASAPAAASAPAPAVAPVPVAVPAPAAVAAVPQNGSGGSSLSDAAKRTHGAAIAATMVALPASPPGPLPGASPRPVALDSAMQPTPPPVAVGATPAPVAATPPPIGVTPGPVAKTPGPTGEAAKGGNTGNFRETLWFKKGDVEQMVAEAKAKAERAKPGAAPPPVEEIAVEDVKPLEDRYVDDGSLTAEDGKKFSLRGAGSGTGLPTVAGGVVPGERMSETEMLSEIGGGKRMAIVAVAIAVVVALAAGLFVVFRSKGATADATKAAKPSETSAEKAPEKTAEPPPAPAANPSEPAGTATAAAAPAAPAPAAAAPAEPSEAPPAVAKEDVTPHKAARPVAARKRPAKKHAGKKRR